MGFEQSSSSSSEINSDASLEAVEAPAEIESTEYVDDTFDFNENFDDCVLSELSDDALSGEAFDKEYSFEDCALNEADDADADSDTDTSDGASEGQNDFKHWIDPENYDEKGKYTGDYKPEGMSNEEYKGQIEQQSKESYAAHLEMQDMPIDERNDAYAEFTDRLDNYDADSESNAEGIEQLSTRNSEAIERFENEADELDLQAKEKFEQFQSMEYKSDEYNQALKDYNELRGRRDEIGESIERLREQQGLLDSRIEPETGENNEQTLEERFDKIEDVPVNELTEEQRAELLEVAKDNLNNKYKDLIPDERIDRFVDSVSFVDESTVVVDFGEAYSPGIMGYYSPETDKIKINIDADGNDTVGNALATIDHEGLHMVSQQTDSFGNPRGVTGLMDESNIDGNVGMNEGVTELLSIRNMQELNPDYESPAYIDEVAVMAEYETVCGSDTLQKAYMENDIESLRNNFDKYMGDGQFKLFCDNMDILHNYSSHGMREQTERTKATLISVIKEYQTKKGEAS